MPKAKLKFPVEDAKKLVVAANFSNVTLGQAQRVGKTLIVETSYRDPQSLVDMVRMIPEVSGDELATETKEDKAAKKK